jgi:hypothetical protein
VFNPNQKSKLEAIDESRMSYVTACKSQKSCATQTKPQRARSGSKRKDYIKLAKSLKKLHTRKSSNLSVYSKKSSRSAFKAKHEVSEPQIIALTMQAIQKNHYEQHSPVSPSTI